MAWQGPDRPEIRFVATSSGFSGWVVSEGRSIAFINTPDTSEARSLKGRLSSPWESDPSLIIVPPDARTASAVWDLLQEVSIKTLVVAGIPEADPSWLSIERYCDEHHINLEYVERWSQLGLGELTISIIATNPDLNTNATLQISSGTSQVAVAMTEATPSTSADLIITDGDAPGYPADFIISPALVEEWPATQLTFDPRDVVKVRFSARGIEISGARVVSAND